MPEGKHTVLAIDDYAINLILIKQALADSCNIYTAKSGKIGLEIMKLVKIDLFLLDIEMPEMSGFDFLRRAKELPEHSNNPVIIISSESKDTTVTEAISLGIVDYITKPFDPNILKEKVLRALRNIT